MTNKIIIIFSKSREHTANALRSPKNEHRAYAYARVCPRITAAKTLHLSVFQMVVPSHGEPPIELASAT